MSHITRVGVVGMGHFAGSHQQAVKALQDQGECAQICACDPNLDAFKKQMEEDWDFPGRRVKVFDNYVTMLDTCKYELDVVTLPTPVPLHAPMHKACVERGIAVYLEKPPTLDYAELDSMLEVEKQAKHLTEVGFNYISDPERREVKQRILNGEFGKVRKVVFQGLWPRWFGYFNRAAWAGRLMMEGRLVLDSCMGNAMAHHIHNILFWAGSGGVFSWGEVEEVTAELYRANSIEGTDTIFAKAKIVNGPEVQIGVTHAARGEQVTEERIVCDDAVLYFIHPPYQIRWNDGRVENGPEHPEMSLEERMDQYFAYVRGESERPMTKLIDSKPFVHFCDLVYVAARKITPVLVEFTEQYHVTSDDFMRLYGIAEDASDAVCIKAIRSIVDVYLESGRFPSEQGISWAKSGGSATRAELAGLRDVVAGMCQTLPD